MSILNIKYSDLNDKSEVLNYLKDKNYKRVLDIGASANGWSSEYLTHYVDIIEWKDSKAKGFLGNICSLKTWESVLEDVEKNGKFDFVICSHTLEDISSPMMVSEIINKIGKGGYVAIPSKMQELSRWVVGPWLGYIHHRWIFNIEDSKLVAYPKLNFIEFQDWEFITRGYDNTKHNQISLFWKDEFKIDFIHDDFIFGTNEEVVNFYKTGISKK